MGGGIRLNFGKTRGSGKTEDGGKSEDIKKKADIKKGADSEKREDSGKKIEYPGNNPECSPGKDFEWRGNSSPKEGKGNWYNPKTGEKWNADLEHGDPIGPHWDYTDASGNQYRVYSDGRVEEK